MGRKKLVRVRALRAFAGPAGVFEPSKTYEVPAALARTWIEQGLVEQTASIDAGDMETKRAKRPERTRKPGRRTRKSR